MTIVKYLDQTEWLGKSTFKKELQTSGIASTTLNNIRCSLFKAPPYKYRITKRR